MEELGCLIGLVYNIVLFLLELAVDDADFLTLQQETVLTLQGGAQQPGRHATGASVASIGCSTDIYHEHLGGCTAHLAVGGSTRGLINCMNC